MKADFGSKLSVTRTSLKLSQAQMAKEIGVSDVILGKWERTEAQITFSNLQKLIETYLRLGVFPKGKELEEAKRLWFLSDETREFPADWFNSLITKNEVEVIPMSDSSQFSDYTKLRQNIDALVDKLLACPSLRRPSSLQQIIEQLPDEIQLKILYPVDNANLTQRMNSIVDACFKVPNGLELLIQRLAAFDKGMIVFNNLLEFLKKNDFDPKL